MATQHLQTTDAGPGEGVGGFYRQQVWRPPWLAILLAPPLIFAGHHWECHEFLQSCSFLVCTVDKNMTTKKS
nr:unnamed protein product [Digitaria exilis]